MRKLKETKVETLCKQAPPRLSYKSVLDEVCQVMRSVSCHFRKSSVKRNGHDEEKVVKTGQGRVSGLPVAHCRAKAPGLGLWPK